MACLTAGIQSSVGSVLAALLLAAATSGETRAAAATLPSGIVVTSDADLDPPPQGKETLRSAIRRIASGGRITFAPRLNGKTIGLTAVGEAHSILKGEVFPAGQFGGFQERDYGRSALYARKDLVIDASALSAGITLSWQGGDANPARVLAVYGNLGLTNVTVTGGHAAAEATGEGAQPYTLGRGGGIAVWGRALLTRCTIAGNRATGDPYGSRDRGAFGGGIYGNLLLLTDCVVSGNAARGYGAAGGGVYSVGGAGTTGAGSRLRRCAVTGNRVTGQHAYGGGVYSDGGGPGNLKDILLENCTLARNTVEDNPDLLQEGQYYYRGGGFYMSNGSLIAASCTIVENAVTGHPNTFSGGKPNMGGGGIAATIGNAHVVESMELRHSIVVGNTVGTAPGDVYTGSLTHFFSGGFNLVGVLDFSQILVPISPWWSLSRKHWPKIGDRAGIDIVEALDADQPRRHGSIVSVGTDTGEPAVIWFPPGNRARDRIPARSYQVSRALAQYTGPAGTEGALLNEVVLRLRDDHGDVLGSDFGSGFGDLSGITFTPSVATWPATAANAPWIAFWRALETEIDGRLGPAGLADAFWRGFSLPSDPGNQYLQQDTVQRGVRLTRYDQRGRVRPGRGKGDIGAIEH